MKRISKIKISDRYIRTKWYVKLFIAALICILIATIAMLIKFYFDVNKENNSTVPDGNIIADFDTVKNNYIIFRNDNGLSGVKDTNDRYIIEPRWNNIFFLSDGRFAVQQKKDNDLSIGIIDSEENLITPFIYEKIVSIGKYFIAAYFNNQSGFALLDTKGNCLSDKIWTSFEYDEKSKVVRVNDEIATYGYKYENDILTCTELKLSAKISNFNAEFSMDDLQLLENISADRIYGIFNSSCVYFSVILGETESSSDITEEMRSNSVSAENLFKNCHIKSIKNISIGYADDESGEYVFSAEILYDYQDGEKSVNNLNSLVSLTFIESEEHTAILKNINKQEF